MVLNAGHSGELARRALVRRRRPHIREYVTVLDIQIGLEPVLHVLHIGPYHRLNFVLVDFRPERDHDRFIHVVEHVVPDKNFGFGQLRSDVGRYFGQMAKEGLREIAIECGLRAIRMHELVIDLVKANVEV